jgi:hypothetical protein
MVWCRFLLIISALIWSKEIMSRSLGLDDDEGVGWEGVSSPREAVESI